MLIVVVVVMAAAAAAVVLVQQGFGVVAMDLEGHGKSDGASLGWLVAKPVISTHRHTRTCVFALLRTARTRVLTMRL